MNSGCSAPTALGGALGALAGQRFGKGLVAPGHHVAGGGGALNTSTFLSVSQPPRPGLVHDGLERQLLAATHLVVGGDDRHRASVDDALLHALAEKPPNTTLCVAPMRAQACMATTPSMVMGM
jgi:hypothetical protein